MPPKKKRKVPQREKPGIARQYLMDNFKDIGTDLKNGHVLYYHLDNQRVVSKTVQFVKGFLGENCTVMPYNVSSLVRRSVDHYKHLSEEAEMRHFKELCNELFLPPTEVKQESTSEMPAAGSTAAIGTLTEAELSPDITVKTPARETSVPSSGHESSASSSTVSTRSTDLFTPRKLKMKKRLDFLSTSKSEMKKKYQDNVKELKSKLKTPKRIINQALKRKDDVIANKKRIISDLRNKLAKNKLWMQLTEIKRQLKSERKKHKKVLRRNKIITAQRVSIKEYEKVKEQLKEKKETIRDLENDNLLLEEKVHSLLNSGEETVHDKKDGKVPRYSSDARLKVFDCIVNQVPTANIPPLLKKISKRSGTEEAVPHRSTVELMARELGAISELQAAETIMANKNVTIGFDATTQEGVHVNSIHFTTKSDCVAAAVDELAGGTAADYAHHITGTVDTLSDTYSYFHGENYQETRTKLINNISNSMSDRCAANSAALSLVSAAWNKSLNELNCHLHPLDSIATSTRSALKKLEESRGKLYGKDCIAANVVLQMNKLRFKDGKGDPRGFASFLDENKLPRGILPRYRGNRLHVLFHICGVFIEHYDVFSKFLKSGTSCGGLRSSILHDFCSDTAKMEFLVLGLLGKHLTGPWMKRFYTSAENEINHVEGIAVVKQVVVTLKERVQHPQDMPTSSLDFFGDKLSDTDTTLLKLRQVPIPDSDLFCTMTKACLSAVIEVLERQYTKYFSWDVDEKLKEETESARSHNIDAEEIMGMFSAAKQRAPNATLCFLSCRMRAKKNRTVDFLDGLDEDRREDLLRKAVPFGRKQRDKRRQRQKDLRVELIKRQTEKKQAKDLSKRRELERKLKNLDLEDILKDFSLNDTEKTKLEDILEGRAVGRKIVHVWYEEGGLVNYSGKIEKLKGKTKKYKVAYWTESQGYDDAVDYDVSMYELAADMLHEDLLISD